MKGRALEGLLAAVLLLLIPVLSISSQRLKSATFDEPINIVHGWRAVATGDIDVPVDYAPLSRWLAGQAVRMGGLAPPDLPWSLGILPQRTQEILYLENEADPIVFRARLAFLPVHLLLGLAVFLTARSLFGRTGGLCALGLAAFSPSLLAHGRLVTNDLLVSTFVFCSHALVYALVRRATAPRLIGAGVCLGLAILSKHSALLAIGTVGLALLWVGLSDREGWPGLLRRGLQAVAIVGLALATVWSFYGLRAAPGDVQEAEARAAAIVELRAEKRLESPSGDALLALFEGAGPLPETYLLGVRYTLKHMEYRLSYFLGERTIEGSPGYFPLVFLFKTPVPLLVLLCVGVGAGVSRRRLPPRAAIPLLLFPAAYFAYSLTASINLGQRYLLPIYPFLFVFAGGVAAAGLASSRQILRVGAAVLLAGFAISSLRIHPDPLSYFNALAGGPRGGARAFGDSNLDWGQDLARLPVWMAEHGVDHVKLGYFGTALPEALGISFEWLPSVGFRNDRPGTRRIREGDYLVVSVTCLQGFYFDDMDTYGFLRGLDPIDDIGGSLYVYRVRRPTR